MPLTNAWIVAWPDLPKAMKKTILAIIGAATPRRKAGYDAYVAKLAEFLDKNVYAAIVTAIMRWCFASSKQPTSAIGRIASQCHHYDITRFLCLNVTPDSLSIAYMSKETFTEKLRDRESHQNYSCHKLLKN